MQAFLDRRTVLCLMLLLPLVLLLFISTTDAYSLDMPGLKGHVARYNSNIDKAPELLKTVLGSELVNLVVTRDNGSVFRAGMDVKNGRIVHLIPEGYNNSTMIVTTNQRTINQVVGAKDKITAFTNQIDQGNIDIQTNNWISDIKIQSLLSSSSVLQFGFNLFFG
ncbi:MAG TPA: hypothetical protein PKK11_03585 [Methanothrix sp.]|nr:hypothetical protein [Methanothrix sp.]HPT19581.1 hypothetical protein [Methanothrix sp.]